MKISLATRISAPLLDVCNHFNRNLFAYLNPPGSKVEILRFDGTKKGDQIILNLQTPIMKGEWAGTITENFQNEQEFYFIDVGDRLPLPLKTWHHKHLVTKIDDHHCLLTDEVNFSTESPLQDKIYYPFFWSMFFWRRHRYQQFFSKVVKNKK